MVIKNIQKALLIGSLLIGFNTSASTNYDFITLFTFENPSPVTALQASTATLAIVIAYELIQFTCKKVNQYIENKIIDSTVDALILAATPIQHLKQTLTKDGYDKALREKARLITMRKNIMNRIETILNDTTSNFSAAHLEEMKKKFKTAKTLFDHVDLLREPTLCKDENELSAFGALINKAKKICIECDLLPKANPYEKNYVLSTIDSYIINQIVSAYILMAKPNNECSPQELQEKSIKQKRNEKIIIKLADKAINISRLYFEAFHWFLFGQPLKSLSKLS